MPSSANAVPDCGGAGAGAVVVAVVVVVVVGGGAIVVVEADVLGGVTDLDKDVLAHPAAPRANRRETDKAFTGQ